MRSTHESATLVVAAPRRRSGASDLSLLLCAARAARRRSVLLAGRPVARPGARLWRRRRPERGVDAGAVAPALAGGLAVRRRASADAPLPGGAVDLHHFRHLEIGATVVRRAGRAVGGLGIRAVSRLLVLR